MYITVANIDQARAALEAAWGILKVECPQILAGELHYQSMVYHSIRAAGFQHTQIGMNVKQHIREPVSELYKSLSARKAEGYRQGFECIPDVVIFKESVNGDWRRRRADWSIQHMLMAIEIKASERNKSRLGLSEVMRDIQKIIAHQQEIKALNYNDILPVMMVIDVAHDIQERMRPDHIASCQKYAEANGVVWLYLSRG